MSDTPSHDDHLSKGEDHPVPDGDETSVAPHEGVATDGTQPSSEGAPETTADTDAGSVDEAERAEAVAAGDADPVDDEGNVIQSPEFGNRDPENNDEVEVVHQTSVDSGTGGDGPMFDGSPDPEA